MSLDRDGNAIVVGNLYVVTGEVLDELADGRVVLDVKRARWVDTTGSGQPTLAVDSVDLIPRPTGSGGPPDPHAASHENGGGDEVDVTGLSGLLADPQTPAAHAASHQHGGADQIATATAGANAIPKAGAGGTLDPAWLPTATETTKGVVELATSAETTAGLAVQASDTRLSDARTPSAHAASHQHGGADGIAVSSPAANAIPKAKASGLLDAAWLDAPIAALAPVAAAANKLPYYTSGTAATVTDLSAAGRALIDDADATAQRATLGLVIGTNVQAQDAELSALAGLTSAADKVPYFTGSGTAAVADFTSTARSLVDDTSTSAMRTTLGLGTAAVLNEGAGGGDLITLATAATAFAPLVHTHSVHGIRKPLALFTANNTSNRTVTSTHTYAVYIGRLSEPLTSCLVWYEVVSAAVTITWAEVAIAKGSPALNNNATLTVVGYTNVASVVNSTGFKTTTVSVSGGQSIGAGDHLWLLFGNQASTAMALRCGSVNASWSGLTLDATSRPSSNVGTGVSYSMEDAACIWSYVAI